MWTEMLPDNAGGIDPREQGGLSRAALWEALHVQVCIEWYQRSVFGFEGTMVQGRKAPSQQADKHWKPCDEEGIRSWIFLPNANTIKKEEEYVHEITPRWAVTKPDSLLLSSQGHHLR